MLTCKTHHIIYSFLFFKTIISRRFIHGANEGVFMSDDFWDKEIETMPLGELKKLQLKRLKALVRYIYDNNRFYHEKLKIANVKPDDIKTLKTEKIRLENIINTSLEISRNSFSKINLKENSFFSLIASFIAFDP